MQNKAPIIKFVGMHKYLIWLSLFANFLFGTIDYSAIDRKFAAEHNSCRIKPRVKKVVICSSKIMNKKRRKRNVGVGQGPCLP